jgi:hypothetical protein
VDHAVLVSAGTAPDDTAVELVRELAGALFLRFIPARTAMSLASDPRLVCTLDRENADYVYRLDDLADYGRPEYKGKRKLVSRFTRTHDARVLELSLADAEAHDVIGAAFDRWLRAKHHAHDPSPFTIERAGVSRWPRTGAAAASARVFALFDGQTPLGASVVEPMWAATWMGVVLKTDPGAQGATAYLRQQVARRLRTSAAGLGWDACTLNIQQDTGAPGLRRAKLSYGPVRLEPKFAVLRNDMETRS